VRVFPVPVDAKVVDAPITGLLYWSSRVIVTFAVVVPFAATPVDGDATMVDVVALGFPAMKSTVSVAVSPLGAVMVIPFVSAFVDLIVPTAIPLAFVVPG
jgi:hypothetical protein